MATPVLLLHGWGGSFAATFGHNGWVQALTRIGRCVLAVNLPGHCQNGASRQPADYGDLAGALLESLPDLGPVDGVAYSLGAKLAIEIASRKPGYFRRLVLGGVGDNIFAPEPDGSAIAAILEQGIDDRTPQTLRAVIDYAAASGADPLALAAILRRAPNPVADPARLARTQASILVVNGENDAIVGADTYLLEALPRAAGLRLAGVGHFDLPSHKAFQEAAVTFLNDQD